MSKHKSKYLSLILRHKPEQAGLTLDEAGWVEVDRLLPAVGMSIQELEELVSSSDKQRFAFSPDKRRIRASQGHSVEVDLSYEPQRPPAKLYHGTATRFLETIRSEGLKKMARHHVHLSSSYETAIKVGARHGKPIVLTVRAGQMTDFTFYCSANGVWLVDRVPPEYLDEDTVPGG